MKYVTMKRGYEVLPDNNIRFGIRITNTSDVAISEVEVILDYSESLFNLEGGKVQKLGIIPPKTTHTAEYILKPLGCIHQVNIEATIIYRDPKWDRHIETMHPKEVHCVCPFLRGKEIQKTEFLNLLNTGHSTEIGLNFIGIDVEQLNSFLVKTCRNRHYVVDNFSIDGDRILYLASESISEKAYYLLTTLIKEDDGLTQIMLRAVSDRPHGLNGFLNETVSELRHIVNTVQSGNEIGVIKREQVINIIDSVVQRTNFAGVNGKVATSINIQNSMVQRTEFSASDDRKVEEEYLRKQNDHELKTITEKQRLEKVHQMQEEEKRSESARDEKAHIKKMHKGQNKQKSKLIAIFLAIIMLMSILPLFFNTATQQPNIDPDMNYNDASGFDSILGTHVNHKFDSIADGLDMTPKGLTSAQYLDVSRILGTPLEAWATNAIQPDSTYNAKLTKTFFVDYNDDASWMELHAISPEVVSFSYWLNPTFYNGYQLLIRETGIYNAIGTPIIFGPQDKVEATIDVLSGSAEKSDEFDYILSYADMDSEFQRVTADTAFASQYYIDLKQLETGEYSRTVIYLDITNSTFENIANLEASSMDRNVAYDVTTDGNITKVVVTGNFYTISGEPVE